MYIILILATLFAAIGIFSLIRAQCKSKGYVK